MNTKKILFLILLLICPLFIQGCWWFGPPVYCFGHAVEKNEQEKDAIRKAQIAKKYEAINKRRAKQGLPPVEPPEYQREKSMLLY